MPFAFRRMTVGGAGFLAWAVFAVSAPALAQTHPVPSIDQLEIDLPAAAQWMLDQPDPVRQAAGLLMQQKMESSSSQTIENSHALQARIADLINKSNEPLSLALLGAVCYQAGIEGRCLELGLAEAIIEHDLGNAISLAYLFPEDSESLRNALLSTQKVDDYIYSIAEVWDRALEDYLGVAGAAEGHLVASFQAMAIVDAIAVPGYRRLFGICKSRIGDSTLAEACARISELASHSSKSLTLRMIGGGIARERALAAGDEALAQQIDNERENMQSRVICIHQQVPGSHWHESNEIGSDWIRSAALLGEVGATEALGEHYNVDCPGIASKS